jgi:glycosyltransferase involved in cell wall biosynthesis
MHAIRKPLRGNPLQPPLAGCIVAFVKRIRVLLVGPLPRLIGGDSVATLNLVRSRYWKDAGIEIVVVNTGVRDRIRTSDERLSRGELFRFTRIMMQSIRALPRVRIVMLWCNSRFLCTAGPVIILMSLVSRRPVIVKMFGTSLPRHIARLPGPWRALVLSMLARARSILPETHALADELIERWRVPAPRVLLFPNFVPDRDIERRSGAKRFTGNCIFMGQIREEKGVFDIIRALRDRKDFRCDFYGPVIERDRKMFEDQIAGSEGVRYRGVVEPSAVVDAMGSYDVLLLPTRSPGEGYPAVVLQAFAAGIPVIASAWKSIPDLVQDGVTGILIPPGSPKSIIDALEKLSLDGKLYSSIVENACAFAETFSEKAVVRDILVAKVLDILA